MNEILVNYFEIMAKNNKLSHAFLLCNTNLDNLKDDLQNILSDYFFNGRDLNILEDSDIYIVKPENGKIVKEDIIRLQVEFNHKSQFNDNRVYIIDSIESMNDHAANSLLKFLEEPEDNIYAFLISSNILKVLPTIKSRCQIINLSNGVDFNLNTFENEFVVNTLEFIREFEEIGSKVIAKLYNYLNKKEEKIRIQTFLKIIKYFYREVLEYKLTGKINNFNEFNSTISFISSKNSEKSLINKLIVLNKYENMLEYNLNLGLFVDKLIIEMEMIGNE